MRLCERDGAFDFAAYHALGTSITWSEALRINAALVVINDERTAYAEWRTSDKGTTAAAGPIVLTLEDYERELTEAREQRDAAQQMLVRHRRAVHEGVEEGRLESGDIEHFELIISICKRRIEGVEEHLRTLAENAARVDAPPGSRAGAGRGGGRV